MLTDIEIAQQAKLRLIKDVASDIDINEDELDFMVNIKLNFLMNFQKELARIKTVNLFS